jgi:hypothetical protein
MMNVSDVLFGGHNGRAEKKLTGRLSPPGVVSTTTVAVTHAALLKEIARAIVGVMDGLPIVELACQAWECNDSVRAARDATSRDRELFTAVELSHHQLHASRDCDIIMEVAGTPHLLLTVAVTAALAVTSATIEVHRGRVVALRSGTDAEGELKLTAGEHELAREHVKVTLPRFVDLRSPETQSDNLLPASSVS